MNEELKRKKDLFEIAEKICRVIRSVLEPFVEDLIENKEDDYEHDNITLLMRKLNSLQRYNIIRHGVNSLIGMLSMEIINVKSILTEMDDYEYKDKIEYLEDLLEEIDTLKVMNR